MSSKQRFNEIARHSDFKPFDGHNWRATWSHAHQEWQIWGSYCDGPYECIGYGHTEQEAWDKAVLTLDLVAV